MVADRRPGHDQVAIDRPAGHGEVRLDAATPVEHLGVDDPPDRHVDVVGAQPLEERARAGPIDLDLGERALIEQAGRTPCRDSLRTNRRRPVLAGPTPRAGGLESRVLIPGKPVRSLPAGFFAEDGTQLGESRVCGRQAQRPASLAFFVRIVDVVVGRVDLGGPSEREGLAPVLAAEPANVHLPQVELRLALDDPVGDLPADATGAGDPVGAQPGRDEEAANLRFAEDELVIRGERLRPVDHPAHPSVGDRGHPPDGPGHDLLEPRQVGREQLAVEVRRDAVQRPGSRVPLVAAHTEPADFLAEIDEVVGIPQLGHARIDAFDGLGEEVLVRQRDDRDRHVRESADLRSEHPAGVDHDVGRDRLPAVAALDLDAGHPPALGRDCDDAGVRADLGATLARPGSQRLRQAGGIEPAVGRQPDGPEDAARRHQREAAACLRGGDQLQGQTERPRPADLPLELLQPSL